MISGNPVLGNRYHLTQRIATGGMGEVWRATDRLLGREVAVKLMRQHVAADPAFRERFRTEARITAGLTDPGIAQVFDYGEQSDLSYLVMELVPGEPLSAILARNGPLNAEVTMELVGQVARALHTAHRSGIIHRDIKPANLLVTETGQVKITDFGIARVLEAEPVTRTGTVLGTAQYVSPEQASGHPLTSATDIYSLGVVAYECLAGRPPFVAENQVAIALMHLNETPPPLPESVPAAVRDLVAEMLAKDPAQRPAGARELADRAMVLRDSVATGEAVGLGELTDPAGFAAPAQPSAPTVREPAAQTWVAEPGEPGLYDAAAIPGMPAPVPAQARTRRARAGAPRRRRATTVAVATAGCMVAVGLGALAVQGLQEEVPTQDTSGAPPVPGDRTPSPRPSVRTVPTTLPPVVPGKSAKPIASPSATVGTSAPSPSRPTPTPTTPSPTPTPTTPAPSPSPPTSEDPTPSASPTVTESPEEES